ncbi:MAG TPA: alpha/beta hydrolase [Vicinamibacterales bacterium]|nr:alpha/beta hydrolase [Vicinamibacterales bacterium]
MRRAVPGSLISVGSHRLHIHRAGNGRPAVVFEAGLAGCYAHWTMVQERMARSTTTCSYDRAGLGWSDAAPGPRTADQIAYELRMLLENAGIPSPRVMVGHSFGALPLRVYAAMFPSEVGGLVLLDPLEPDEWVPTTIEKRRTIEKGLRLCGLGVFSARIGVAHLVAGLAGRELFPFARFVVSLASRGGFTRTDEHILAPFTRCPPDVGLAQRAIWTQPKCFRALGEEIRSIPVSAAQAARAEIPRGLQLIVVSAGDARPLRLDARARLVSQFDHGCHTIASGSSHWIQLDQPALVVDTVLDLVAAAAFTRA